METKSCSKCGSEYQKRKGKTSYCPSCQREYAKENYHQNKERYFKHAKIRDQKLDQVINERKDVPCKDCGVKYPPFVMDFDHINPENKEFSISRMRRSRMAFKKIIAEIEKCDVVCANCHRIRTNDQNPARYMKYQNDPSAT